MGELARLADYSIAFVIRAVCRLGVMFFDDAIASIREMLRVVRPDGRVAFAVWHES